MGDVRLFGIGVDLIAFAGEFRSAQSLNWIADSSSQKGFHSLCTRKFLFIHKSIYSVFPTVFPSEHREQRPIEGWTRPGKLRTAVRVARSAEKLPKKRQNAPLSCHVSAVSLRNGGTVTPVKSTVKRSPMNLGFLVAPPFATSCPTVQH